jgi:hypothetical protein
MQRYIATSVQRRDSNVSTNWGLVDDGAGVFSRSSSSFFRRSSTKAADSSLGGWAEQQLRWLLAGWPKLAGMENKSGDNVGLGSRRGLAKANRLRVSLFIAQWNATVIPN